MHFGRVPYNPSISCTAPGLASELVTAFLVSGVPPSPQASYLHLLANSSAPLRLNISYSTLLDLWPICPRTFLCQLSISMFCLAVNCSLPDFKVWVVRWWLCMVLLFMGLVFTFPLVIICIIHRDVLITSTNMCFQQRFSFDVHHDNGDRPDQLYKRCFQVARINAKSSMSIPSITLSNVCLSRAFKAFLFALTHVHSAPWPRWRRTLIDKP